MNGVRMYGHPPFDVAVVHGGPGAPGEMAPVARELARTHGVLEPLQAASSLQGQVVELEAALRDRGHLPAAVIGHSWGAMLGFVLAAQRPSLVKKLILVSSGAFDKGYAEGIEGVRLSRLSAEEILAVDALSRTLSDPSAPDKDRALAELGRYMSKADAFDPLPECGDVIRCQYDINRRVWRDVEQLRSSGRLLALGKHIGCPVVAIHGDYDSHPAEGVRAPLSGVLRDFRFILLEKCGHRPWLERAARDRFFCILDQELGRPEQAAP